MERSPADKPPCSTCPKIPKGRPHVPDSAVELNSRNYKAYQHWKECRAVGQFPDDAIVRRNASVMHDLWEEFNRKPLHELMAILPVLMMKK